MKIIKFNKDKIIPMVFILLGGLGVLILKLIAFYISNSMALKSDVLESLINILAGMFALFSILYANKPADMDHPYGHGKIEFFSAFFEGGLIILASILIIFESLEKLVIGFQLQKLSLGLAINFIAGSLNGLMGYWLISISKKKKSNALEADGRHLLSDFYTTLGIFVGLILASVTGYYFLDPIISFILGVFLLITGFQIVINSTSKLMDAENQNLIKRIVMAINEVDYPNIINVHGLRVMESGNYIHIDAHLVVPEFYTVKEIHEYVDHFEKEVLKKLNVKGELHSHVDPCKRNFCKICKIFSCSIRLSPYLEENKLTYETAILWPIEDRKRMKNTDIENL